MLIFITGTSSGIGHALALEYLRKGHRVYGVSRHVKKDLEAFDTFHFLQQDISRFDELATNLSGFLQHVDRIDLVILNAGILPQISDLGSTGMEEIRRVMNINVWANKVIIDSLFTGTRKVMQVVAVSSGASVSGSRGWNAYALSKATLNMLIDLYSKEHTETHFIALAPGIINTGMQEYIRSLPDPEKYPVVKRLTRLYEESKMMEVEEAVPKLIRSFSRVRELESGSFADVRKLEAPAETKNKS